MDLSRCPSISSTFEFDCCEQGGRRFAGEESGYIYTRLGNPTTSVVEAKVAALEGGEAAAAAASGMGAISACLWSIAGAGKHIIADETLYGCTFALLSHGMTQYGVEVTFTDLSKVENLSRPAGKHLLRLPGDSGQPQPEDLRHRPARQGGPRLRQGDIMVVCDNVFALSALQNPLALGADVWFIPPPSTSTAMAT